MLLPTSHLLFILIYQWVLLCSTKAMNSVPATREGWNNKMTENSNEEGAGGRGRWVSDQILPRKLKIPTLAIKLIKSLYCNMFNSSFLCL